MPAITNTTTTEDLAAGMDIEMVMNFQQEYDRLAEILGIVSPEIIAAGTALYQFKVEGKLNTADVAEGEETPLSKYTTKKVPVGEIEFKPYRKLTTAQAILKSGYGPAVLKTDAQMLKDVRANIIAKFFAFLAKGTGKAEGNATLQAAIAMADTELDNAMEDKGDKAETIVHFVNRTDIGKYLAETPVTVQTVFGMTYLQNFLGMEHAFVTNKVPQGTVYVTPAENIHMYGVDFGALAQADIDYTVVEGSLIGVHHEPNWARNSAETFVGTGATLMAEILDYIVKGTFEPTAAAQAAKA
ncbi:hypothetical protein [uncultured Adlercreutzia sp.]|uniref:hypothetical protein n=1 Tax=uncultured Adlercreutzia sp. TaxID=875803 RepID=UPI0025D2BACA|nr:hypothetical protein [uncultured Adlercreutzia sp.]